MKNKNLNLAFLRQHKVTKGNHIRRAGRMEEAADVGRENIPGGKAVAVD